MIRDYEIKKKLGVGTYGVVYMVSKKSKSQTNNDNNLYVIKQIPLFGLTSSEIKEVKSEANILSQIKSTYVVKYLDSFEENNNLNIVMEYCEGGDLEKIIENKKKFPLDEEFIWKIFIQITLGLTAIHNLKILHRDLKSSNIFLTKEFNVKIGDLGVAKKLSRGSFAKTIIGTPYYLSPEICEEKPYNEKSDIWALGCILYELCTFNHPFNAKSQGALILKILNSSPTPIKQSYNENLQKLINFILEKSMYKRPSCKTILKLPYIIEKIKKFKMNEEYQNIGLKLINKANNFKKIVIKRAKININDDDINIKKTNIKNYRDKCLTSNDGSANKNNTQFNKRNNPWSDYYTKNNQERKNAFDNKMIKKNTNNCLKKIANSNYKTKNNNSFVTKMAKINIIDLKNKKVNKNDKSPLNNKEKNNKLNRKVILKKDISKSVKNTAKKNEEKKNNPKKNEERKNTSKKIKNKIIKIDLTNTLELNQIINNYLDKGENLRDSKNLENIKEFADNLNNYFSYNYNIINNDSINKDNLPIILTNKDNNVEQNNERKEENNNINNNSNCKKEHEDILNFNIERLTPNKMGVNSYDELINDFSASRGPTIANSLNNNLSNNSSKSPFEYQIINNSINNYQNINNLNSRESSEFQVFDNKISNISNNLNNKDNNLCESDDDEKFDIINANNNEQEDENSEKDNSSEENVKTIIHCEEDNRISSVNNKDEKKRIIEDKNMLINRLESIKKEMLSLIGENDYNYVMELYSIIDKTKIDEIYFKIEEYVQKYEEDKKDKFDILYFKLISTDCQVQQKNNELQNLFLNDF